VDEVVRIRQGEVAPVDKREINWPHPAFEADAGVLHKVMIQIDPAKVIFDRLLKENPGASAAKLQRLFLAAAMDDPEIMQAVLEDVQDRMFAFDPARAARVLDLMTSHDPAAEEAFESLLEEMRPQ
jgi:hypothetical protein